MVRRSFRAHSVACEHETMWLREKSSNFVVVGDNKMPFGTFTRL